MNAPQPNQSDEASLWVAACNEQRARKEADRAELAKMPPNEAQSAVEAILHPRLWRIADPKQLDWPGDWADDEKGD